MISQQSFGSSDLPFPSGKAKQAPREHTTLPTVALFSSQVQSSAARVKQAVSTKKHGLFRAQGVLLSGLFRRWNDTCDRAYCSTSSTLRGTADDISTFRRCSAIAAHEFPPFRF
jgi:hypothetical protein